MTERVDVEVAGGRLATFRLGAQRPDAPLVLAIHGITSTSRTWLAVARALGDRAALIAVDLRGRGRSSELPPPFGLDAHVADMLAVLDHVGLERAVVTGHSLGAYIAARLAVRRPDRVDRLILVDGGLTIPESRDVDPERFMADFLGPTLARLRMTFPDPAAYVDWWRAHPAVATADIDAGDLEEYATHDLAGEPPQLRSSVNPEVVRDDGLDLFGDPDAERLTVPAVLLCAPRGMVDDPNPMQPLTLVERWAAADPRRRRAIPVPDVNHYTIAWGAHGSQMVADAIAEAVAAASSSV
ncbi:MAG TPA: alpha/beta fold hydrolase [Solirubrobacteraceae bacterium]|jgi:pimeloyl-ACP methyl ester carboxylesterase|nr:alpha/beta fold hydrolase [Solirubrobacteraceae bacterium]